LIDPDQQISDFRPHTHGKSVQEGLEIVGFSLVNNYARTLSLDFGGETNPSRGPIRS
jgi:hypothetical protein